MTTDRTLLPIGPHDASAVPACWFLSGDDEMSARVRAHDWSATPLGPIETWSTHLKSVVGTALATPFPAVLWWGGALTQIYNDAARLCFDVLQAPQALGQEAAIFWSGEWALFGPQVEQVAASGRAVRHRDVLVPISKGGRIEECYWTYSYTPLFGATGTLDGFLVASAETTQRVLAERRQGALDRLRAGLAGCITIVDVQAQTRDAAALVPRDIVGLAFSGAVDLPATGRRIIVESGLTNSLGKIALGFDISDTLPYDAAFQRFLEQFTNIVASAKLRIEADNARSVVQEERDRLLLDAPVGAAVMIGDALTYQLVNPIYAMVAGREAQWMVGKPFLEVFPELDGSPVHRSFLAVYRAGVPFVGDETLVQIHKHGGVLEDRYFTYNLSPLTRVDGSVYGLMVIAVDITVQVQARTRIEELNVELNQSSRAKDEFLALLGHELRNPLAPIVTALELMKMRDSATQREQAVIQRQVVHLVRLVDDLLDVSRITRGKIELRKEVVVLADVVAKAAEMVAAAIAKKRQVLAIDSASANLLVDPARLAQILSNLLTNASRHTPEGGHISLRAAVDGARVTIEVRDDGAGIAASLLPRIFEPFVQGERKLQGSVGGLGIGLALVKNLVELHGGSVTAHSAGDATGSTFTIVLPRGLADADAQVQGRLPDAASGAAFATVREILIVDDNVDAADFLAELLVARGQQVRVAYDPAGALRACASRAPQLAILDIGLPDMDGYQLAEQLRRLPGCAGLPCIALTGFGQQVDKARSAQAAFAAHLVKPIEMRELVRIFNRLDGAA